MRKSTVDNSPISGNGAQLRNESAKITISISISF
jgi:hypothetical protein